MKGMFLFSTFVHIAFFMLFAYLPELGHRQIVYTPVYTVDLLSLPEPESSPSKKTSKKKASPKKKPKLKSPPPRKEQKPLEFHPPLMDKNLLKKLEKFEKKIKNEEKPKEKTKEIKETSLSEMLTDYEKKWLKDKTAASSEELPNENEEQKSLLEKLAMMEKKWEKWDEKKSEEAEKREEVDPRTVEEDASGKTDKKIRLRQANIASQTPTPVAPSHLNRYYAIILSRIHEKWLNPLSIKRKDSELEVPGLAYFEILPNGEINNIRVEESSGDEFLDSLVKKAILDSSPLPPPPKQISSGKMDVFLDFKYIFEK